MKQHQRQAMWVGIWILAGCSCLMFDRPLAAWLIGGALPSDIRALFQRVESFGHTYGLICILVTIYLLDPAGRKHLASILSAFAVAGLSADLLKLQVWRLRPRDFFAAELDGSSFVGSILWGARPASWLDHAYHSFPSAHTACAVALAYRLGQAYPAGRHWFLVLATLCALNRIDGGAHFASDVCWGAALGYGVAAWLPPIELRSDWLRRPIRYLPSRRPTLSINRSMANGLRR